MAKPSPQLLEKMMKMYDEGANFTDVGRAISRDRRYAKKYVESELERRRASTERAEASKEGEGEARASKGTRALSMIKEGRDLVDVAIETGLSADEVEQVKLGFWKLRGMGRLESIYGTVGPDELWQIVDLHEMIAGRRLSSRSCLDRLKGIHDLENRMIVLQDRCDSLAQEAEIRKKELLDLKKEKGEGQRGAWALQYLHPREQADRARPAG